MQYTYYSDNIDIRTYILTCHLPVFLKKEKKGKKKKKK